MGIYWIYPLLKGSKRGVKQPPKGTSIFPMIHPLNERRDNFRSHRISDQCSQGARKNRSFFTWVWNQKHPWNESWEKTHLRFFSNMEKLPRGLQDAGVVYKPISVEQKSEEMSPKNEVWPKTTSHARLKSPIPKAWWFGRNIWDFF